MHILDKENKICESRYTNMYALQCVYTYIHVVYTYLIFRTSNIDDDDDDVHKNKTRMYIDERTCG
jgi:hypothetical protein